MSEDEMRWMAFHVLDKPDVESVPAGDAPQGFSAGNGTGIQGDGERRKGRVG